MAVTIEETRSKGISYQQLLDTDTRPVPEVLRLQSRIDFDSEDIPVDRYTTQAFHQLEVEKLWKRVWQMACREEDIPAVGDSHPYDIAGLSFLVVRVAPGTIKAYYNACLHRGRKLREFPGRVRELRCPFHGFAWQLDGTLKQVPCAWDFPQIDPAEWHLPEVNVATWGGFVFINPDPDAPPFDDFVGTLGDHFARWPLEERYKEAHVGKIIRCNWKVCQEAFMEAFHVVATHPQLLPGIGDANSQYDVFGNFTRAITPNGTPSPHLSWAPTEQEMLDAMVDRRLDEEQMIVVPEGRTAREVAAAGSRDVLRPIIGDGADDLCDAELMDSMYYTLFPNFHPWGSYNRIVYRFRPNGEDHNSSIMECMYLSPFRSGERPPAAPIHWLSADDDWTEAPELGFLARVFNQDSFNLPHVQGGLHATKKPGVTFAHYQETKIRHFHRLLDHHLSRP
jgi:phenylpropionate dioxygenase-like ring-hydroxylating dioxygenase large terminal subunit